VIDGPAATAAGYRVVVMGVEHPAAVTEGSGAA
jgi:hypothetical protein